MKIDSKAWHLHCAKINFAMNFQTSMWASLFYWAAHGDLK